MLGAKSDQRKNAVHPGASVPERLWPRQPLQPRLQVGIRLGLRGLAPLDDGVLRALLALRELAAQHEGNGEDALQTYT